MSSAIDQRILMLALDGATFDVIGPMVDRGELPFIARIMSEGLGAVLLSTVPPITPPAWSSLATGAAPLEHGVFGFSYPAAADYALRMTTSADRRRATLWRRLSEHGLRVLLLDAPFTHPPEPVNGFVVSGFPIYGGRGFDSASSYTHPPELRGQLEARGIRCPRHPDSAPEPSSAAFLDWLDALLRNRLELFRHLSAAAPWRFAMVGTMALDWAQHDLWRFYDRRFVHAREPQAPQRREALFAVYRRIDRFIAELAEVAGPGATVILVSDHGFGAAFHYDWIARALEEAGLLRWKTGGQSIARRIAGAALRVARSSAWLQRAGRRLLGCEAERARAWARQARSFDNIDWERTRVFASGDFNLNLYVNTKSRFARGIVAGEDEYRAVLEAAVQALETFRCPPSQSGLCVRENRSIVRRIERIEGGAKGLPTSVPDLALDLEVLPLARDAGDAVETAGLCAFHSPEGICITNSTDWLEGRRPERLAITEIAPAVLRYFGVPFERDREAESTIPTSGVPGDSTAPVLDQLRKLGYID
jgi:predicted AlkP superfamily phosphohydrolase/phosphomutase